MGESMAYTGSHGSAPQDLMAASRAVRRYSRHGHAGSHGGEPGCLSLTSVILLSSHPNIDVFFQVSMEYCFHTMLPKGRLLRKCAYGAGRFVIFC
jgi:hypothetical protein